MRILWLRLALISALVAPWLMGLRISELSASGWIVYISIINAAMAAMAVKLNRLMPFADLMLANILFYMVMELDAPAAVSPWLLYPVIWAIFGAGMFFHYFEYKRNLGRLAALMVSFSIVSLLFMGLDMGWFAI